MTKDEYLNHLSREIEIILDSQFDQQSRRSDAYMLCFVISIQTIENMEISIEDIRKLAVSKLDYCASLLNGLYYICLLERTYLDRDEASYEYFIKRNENGIKLLSSGITAQNVTILKSCYKVPYYNEEYWT